MKIQPLNKIVTNFFLVVKHQDDKVRFEPGLDLLASSLVRTAAHKIFIPSNTPSNFPKIEETIKQYPPSLAHRVEVVDKDRGIYNKVSKYLKPVYEETGDSPHRIHYGFVFDFLYKLTLASKLQAEADIHYGAEIGYYIEALKQNVNNEEARFRLEQLYGIYYTYQKPDKIDTLTMLPHAGKISIYQRVTDLLDEAEIIELSNNRYFLGIPSKAKLTMIKIRKLISKILADRKYSNQITGSTDLIQTVASSAGISIPLTSVYQILKNIQISSYNPPIVDLDYFRFKIAREFDKGINVILPIGTYGTTVSISEDYFQTLSFKYEKIYSK